jgi:diguanylate cyclase (GGDEF)-like protein
LRRQLAIIVVFSLLVLSYEIWDAYDDYTWYRTQTPLIARMQKDEAEIARLDEIATTSVQWAVASGDPYWVMRYRQSEPKLAQLLADAVPLDSNASGAGVAEVNAMHKALVAVEERSLELMRQGNHIDAQHLLSSPEYEGPRKAYANDMEQYSEDVLRAGDSVDSALLNDLFWNGVTATGAAILLILGSFFVFRLTRRWQAALVASNRALNLKTAELLQFNDRLDRKVGERTKELRDSAIASLNMMEDALRHREDAEKSNEKLDYLSNYDSMTGFANQSLFLERLQAKFLPAQNDQHKLAVFVLDIERFKSINDALGRKAGDELLRLIAERLVQVGGGDASRFARLGADRFAIVSSGMDDADEVGRYVEQRLDANFRAPFRVGDHDLRVFVKVGIALFPDDGTDADTLLRNAEAALKKAKGTGERYLFFAQKMTERVAERLSMENRLRHALDNDEFVLHYQPKVNLISGKLTSAEALIRWNDPKTGLVPPMQFISILEETGLIHEVGRWAMAKAIEDYLRWRNAGLPAVRIAVNVSPLQLRNRGFIAEIEQALAVDAQAAAGLELEITESLIMEDVKHSIAALGAIRAMGVTIAIDDFGTGYSSLSYLSKLPVDTLKIDRSFIIDMTIAPEGLSLVSTIITLAHSLELKVVAEGVETEEQSRLLRLLRCDEMQGYLFSKPVPGDIFETRFLSPMTNEQKIIGQNPLSAN